MLDIQGPLGSLVPHLANLPVTDITLDAFSLDDALLRLLGEAGPPSPHGFGEAGILIALVCRSFGRIKILFAALTAVLIALQISIIAAASSFVDSGDFTRLAQILPTFLLQALGPALSSFQGMVMFAYFDPLIVMLLVQFAIYLATEPAGDVESNVVDLILARPLPRHWLVTRSVLVMMIGHCRHERRDVCHHVAGPGGARAARRAVARAANRAQSQRTRHADRLVVWQRCTCGLRLGAATRRGPGHDRAGRDCGLPDRAART